MVAVTNDSVTGTLIHSGYDARARTSYTSSSAANSLVLRDFTTTRKGGFNQTIPNPDPESSGVGTPAPERWIDNLKKDAWDIMTRMPIRPPVPVPAQAPSPAAASKSRAVDTDQRLRDLDDLDRTGAITFAEYQARRAAILGAK